MMERYIGIRDGIQEYVEREIVPRYAGFDDAHKEDHALTVIRQAMKLLDTMPDNIQVPGPESNAGCGDSAPAKTVFHKDIDREILFTAAACHDLGLINGRENHHTDSGCIIRNDEKLRRWFTEEQIETIAMAAEDHRASGKRAPRSIYGMLLAEADRVIDPDTIIRRTIQFGLAHYPQLDAEGHQERAVSHLKEKYGKGGYLRLWIPWSDNSARLQALQDMIDSPEAIRAKVREAYNALLKESHQDSSRPTAIDISCMP